MLGWIAVNLACRRLQDFAFKSLGEAKHIDRAMNRGFGRLHGVMLIKNGGRRAGEIVYLVYFGVEWERYVVPQQFKPGFAQQVNDIGTPSCKEVVNTKDFVPLLQQSLTQM